jgi:hypothetical protein
MAHGLKITADGKAVEVLPGDGKKFSLEEMQKLVGGYIERVGTIGRKTVYADEEGLLKGLPLNPVASERVGRPIVGTVLVV